MDSYTPLAAFLLLFIAVGVGFIFVHLVAGKFLRPNKPDAEKKTIYECGEPTIGSAWIQVAVIYYLFALLFLAFDVDVLFLLPVLLAYGKGYVWRDFIEVTIFIGILSLVIVYAWNRGVFSWKRKQVNP